MSELDVGTKVVVNNQVTAAMKLRTGMEGVITWIYRERPGMFLVDFGADCAVFKTNELEVIS